MGIEAVVWTATKKCGALNFSKVLVSFMEQPGAKALLCQEVKKPRAKLAHPLLHNSNGGTVNNNFSIRNALGWFYLIMIA